MRVLLKIVLTNFDTIFKLITYIAVVTVASRDYGMHTFELFNIAIIMWSFFSFVIPTSNTTLLNKLSVYIVFPTFILGLIFTKFYSSLMQAKILSQFIKSSDSSGDMSRYFKHQLGAFIPFLIYTVFQALRTSKSLRKFFMLSLSDIHQLSSADTENQHLEYLMVVVRLVIKMIIQFSRYITLSIAMASSLVTVNVPNTIMLSATLFFFWTSDYDQKLWRYYIYYNICFLSIMYLNQVLPNELESFNHEFLSIIGFSRRSTTCKSSINLR